MIDSENNNPVHNDEATNESFNKDPESIAKDRVAHGLLGFLHHDTADEKNRRVRKVLAGIDRSTTVSVDRHRRFIWRAVPLASAAMLTIITLAIFVITPQPNAYAIVNTTIAATRSSDLLRYEIFAAEHRHGDQDRLIGTLDMSGERSLVQIETPGGHDFVMGRDSIGDWSYRQDATVDRQAPRDRAPRWINLGESTILIDSVDILLEQLQTNYSVEEAHSKEQQAAGDSDIHLIATLLPNSDRSHPNQINITIDTQSSLVDRLELKWDRDETRRGPPRDGSPPPPPDHNPPPPPDEQLFDEFFGPELLLGPPLFDDHHHPPPPTRIVFQRVEAVPLTDDQFSPAVP